MTQSKQTAPHFYLTMDADMAEVTPAKKRFLKEKGEQLIRSINDYILSACAPSVEGLSITERGLHRPTRLEGLTPTSISGWLALEEGLVVPVIRNADRLSHQELTQTKP